MAAEESTPRSIIRRLTESFSSPSKTNRSKNVTTGMRGSDVFTPQQFEGIMLSLAQRIPELGARYGHLIQDVDIGMTPQGLIQFRSNTIPLETLEEMKRAFGRNLTEAFPNVPAQVVGESKGADDPSDPDAGEAPPLTKDMTKEVTRNAEGEPIDLSSLSLKEIQMLAPFLSAESIRHNRSLAPQNLLERIREENTTVLHPTVPDPVVPARRLP